MWGRCPFSCTRCVRSGDRSPCTGGWECLASSGVDRPSRHASPRACWVGIRSRDSWDRCGDSLRTDCSGTEGAPPSSYTCRTGSGCRTFCSGGERQRLRLPRQKRWPRQRQWQKRWIAWIAWLVLSFYYFSLPYSLANFFFNFLNFKSMHRPKKRGFPLFFYLFHLF
jgi:hypothetical protein